MRENGFRDYVANSINKSKPTFPLILKATEYTASSGIFLINNQIELNKHLSNFKGKKVDYIYEEALIGMKNIEGQIFASSFQGELLSLRCTLRYILGIPNSEAFIYLFYKTEFQTYNVSCGSDLSGIILAMTKKSKFTGSFNIDFKANSSMHFKFMDMNPRISGTVAHRIELFTAAYIPLSFAINRYRIIINETLQKLSWYNDQSLIDFSLREKEIATSGSDGEHIDVMTQVQEFLKVA